MCKEKTLLQGKGGKGDAGAESLSCAVGWEDKTWVFGQFPLSRRWLCNELHFFQVLDKSMKRRLQLEGLKGNGSVTCREQGVCGTCFQESVSSGEEFSLRSWWLSEGTT